MRPPSLIRAAVALAFGLLLIAPTAASAQDTTAPTTVTTPPVAPSTFTDAAAEAEPEAESRPADAEAERNVRRIALVLVGIAVLMGVVTALYWRATRPLDPNLVRLDVMGSRAFRSADSLTQREMLGAGPLGRLASIETSAAAHPAAAVDCAEVAQAADAAEVPLHSVDPGFGDAASLDGEEPADEAAAEEAVEDEPVESDSVDASSDEPAGGEDRPSTQVGGSSG
jgi:hypothetical protein